MRGKSTRQLVRRPVQPKRFPTDRPTGLWQDTVQESEWHDGHGIEDALSLDAAYANWLELAECEWCGIFDIPDHLKGKYKGRFRPVKFKWQVLDANPGGYYPK
eukprot:10856748-Lingulodinium_polyedra.AAC.1